MQLNKLANRPMYQLVNSCPEKGPVYAAKRPKRGCFSVIFDGFGSKQQRHQTHAVASIASFTADNFSPSARSLK